MTTIPTKNTQEIIKLLQSQQLKKYLKKKGINHLYLFGSYVHGNSKKNSDIDLLYEQNKEIGWEFFDIVNYLSEITKKKIDLVAKDYLNKHIKEQVLSHTIRIF